MGTMTGHRGPDGGTGRRARLKIWFSQESGSSILPPGTTGRVSMAYLLSLGACPGKEVVGDCTACRLARKARISLGFEAGEPKRQNAFWTATSQEFLLTWYERLTYISGCLCHSTGVMQQTTDLSFDFYLRTS